MDTTIRLGVLGCGYWGPNLIRNFVELPNSQVAAVVDLSEARLRYAQSRYPAITVTQDYRDLFGMALDAVVIATPPATHFGLAKECLAHGLHVLVEKPITLNSEDARTLVMLAEQGDLTLMVGHTFEYNTAVRALRDIITRGELGQVFYIDSVRANLGLYQRDLNVVWDLAPHDISIIRYLLGQDPIGVSAQGQDCILNGVQDVAHICLTFPGGIAAYIHVSWLDPCKVRRTTVVGDRKMAVYDDVEPLEKIRIYDKGVEKPPYTDTFGDFQLSYRYGDVVLPYIQVTEPLRIECQHFIESILNHTRPQSDGIDGLRVVKALEAAQRSLQSSGQHTAIIYDEEPSYVRANS
jgi:predicted dehydrogenase